MNKLERSVFFRLSPSEQHKFLDAVRAGKSEIVDDTVSPLPSKASLTEKQISRNDWDKLSVFERSAKLKHGVVPVDTQD